MVKNGLVVINTGHSTVALEADSGLLRWTFKRGAGRSIYGDRVYLICGTTYFVLDLAEEVMVHEAPLLDLVRAKWKERDLSLTGTPLVTETHVYKKRVRYHAGRELPLIVVNTKQSTSALPRRWHRRRRAPRKVVLGTAAYMSPEQAKGNPMEKRTDIQAFGAVLYQMLSGKKAFPGLSRRAIRKSYSKPAAMCSRRPSLGSFSRVFS